MFFFSAAHAQIIYTDVDPDQTCNGNCTYNLDLNNDGVTDFQLQTTAGTSCGGHPGNSVHVLPDTFNRIVNSNAYPAKLDTSILISLNSSWNPALTQILSAHFWMPNYNGGCHEVSFNHWVNASDGYLGLEINVAGQYYYGWAQLSVGLGTVTIRDYAYNSISDSSILAGDSGIPLVILNPLSKNIFSVFPNPGSNKITLSFSSSEKKQIKITNTLGQIVFAEEINSAREEIDVSEFPAGMYVVSVQTATHKIERKFLKQ